eukprot:7385892-Prymnesium_polylepis.1
MTVAATRRGRREAWLVAGRPELLHRDAVGSEQLMTDGAARLHECHSRSRENGTVRLHVAESGSWDGPRPREENICDLR